MTRHNASRRLIAPLPVSLLATLLAACGGSGGGGATPDEVPGLPPLLTTTPENQADGWPISSPAAEDIDGAALQAILVSIRDGGHPKVDSMVVARHGRLVAEGYFNGYGRETLHDLRSTGKSFTSALAGIAVDRGLMTVSDPISQHIPDFDSLANLDARKRRITVRHLLDMASGLDCNDSNPTSLGNEEKMYPKSDWVKFILDLPMAFEPGSASTYCTGGVVVLGDLIAHRSGMGLDTFASTWLFTPLGIRQAEWRRSPDGQATGGGGLKLRPRDLAKLGQLYLDGGVWNGAQVVPEAWVAESRLATTRIDGQGYGYLWWKREFPYGGTMLECFYTSGNGGNFVFVFPALDLVAAFTGSNYNSNAMNQPIQILNERLLPAVR